MSARTDLDLQRFQEWLDVYGAELDRWPASLQAEGRTYLAESEDARRMWEASSFLEAQLAALPPLEPSAELLRSVREIPLRHPRPAGEGWLAWWPWGSVFKTGAALAAAALMGLVAGSVSENLDLPLAGLTEDGWGYDAPWTEQEAEELSELAFALHLEGGDWEEWP